MDIRRQEREAGKVERIPLAGPRLKLQLSKQDRQGFDKRGTVPYVFNDQDGRVEQAQTAGYKFTKPENARSFGSTDSGDGVSKIVTKGNDLVMRAYLMDIKQEFYNEDQASKLAVTMKVDEALALGGKGEADVEMAYVP